jgi:hypothetical protein
LSILGETLEAALAEAALAEAALAEAALAEAALAEAALAEAALAETGLAAVADNSSIDLAIDLEMSEICPDSPSHEEVVQT